MFPDLRFEAAFLRTALLAGIVRESDACAWADALLQSATAEQGPLAEVAIAPLELTAMREALRPLAGATLSTDVGAALLAFAALDPATASLEVPDLLRVLSVLRRENVLSDAASRAAKEFEDRHMLASVGVAGEAGTTRAELATWLHATRPAAHFRFAFEHDDEQAAFLAALSRVVVRERRSPAPDSNETPRAWTVGHSQHHRGVLVLNERLWMAAARAFSPLPIGSRIPYIAVPAGAAVVLDDAIASPMGFDDAVALLAV